MSQPNQNNNHVPVLLDAVLHYLNPQPDEAYLDLTAGYGGHAAAVINLTRGAPAVLVDRDRAATAHLKQELSSANVKILSQDFLNASQQLKTEGQKFKLILADLGVSSPHLNIASRGFSIAKDGPLDMRMDNNQELTADEIVNNYSETDLANIIHRYGEERISRKLARAIINNRPINSTHRLAQVVATAKYRKHGRIHPATQVFQALRIAVNDELNLLEQAMPIWLDMLEIGGRLVVISFHSLEDRLVKKFFKDHATGYDGDLQILTKKPIVADNTELVSNPRARSAKLRAAVKIKT